MRIQLSTTTNPKLLLAFPNDPYSDLHIRSSAAQYHLQFAFLWIQSEYFEQAYTHKLHQVDLSHLPEPHLEHVLRSFYGDTLTVENFRDLERYYEVIEYLRIGEYRRRVVDGLQKELQEGNPIEMLQFCFTTGVLVNQVKQMYINSNLQVLQDQKYYLQLNKIQPKVLIKLLKQYLLQSPYGMKQQVTDSILDSYFSRNKLQPYVFFTTHQQQQLFELWQRSHQFYDKMLLQTQHTQNTYTESADSMPKTPKTNNIVSDSAMWKMQDRVRELQAEVEMQRRRILELEEMNRGYEGMIGSLRQENQGLRRDKQSHGKGSSGIKGSPPRLQEIIMSTNSSKKLGNDITGSSKKQSGTFVMVQSIMPQSAKKLDQSQVTCFCGQTTTQSQFQVDDADLAITQTPIPVRLLTIPQQTKTLNQLKATQRNKKIFN